MLVIECFMFSLHFLCCYNFYRVKTDLDGGNPRVTWDGIEIRLLRLMAERNNFSIEIKEPQELSLGWVFL